jgi:hypothetical protein
MSRSRYQVVLKQNLNGTTVVSDPFDVLDGAYAWLKAYGVANPKDSLSGDVHSDGSAVIGSWEIRRVLGG